MAFKWNGKLWNPKDPEKKLKKLGITWDDVKIIEDKKDEVIEYVNPMLYAYKLEDGYLFSIYKHNLDNYLGYKSIEEWDYELFGKD